VLVVGYDDNQSAWILRNSWGPAWGDNGYALFGYGECKIDDFAKLGVRNVNPDPWSRRRVHNGCFIESGNGETHRNFELVRSATPRVRHLWRQGGENGDFGWHDAGELSNPNDPGAGAAAIGMPAVTATTYNRNFETVYWEGSGWLRHWFLDQASAKWCDGGRFGDGRIQGFPGFIQSSYGAPGNFEVAVRGNDGDLRHWWREGPPNFAWHDGGSIAQLVRMSGPSLVQSVGDPGNLYVVAVMVNGQLQLWWRDDQGGTGWHAGEVFAEDIGETPPVMIQGQFGMVDELGVGNFELIVAVNGSIQHWWRDNSALAIEPPRSQHANIDIFDEIDDLANYPERISAAERAGITGDIVDLANTSKNQRVVKAANASIGSVVTEPWYKRIGIDVEHFVSRWHHGATFGSDVKHAWGLLQGSFGFNLEAIIERTDSSLQHWYRDGEGWHEGETIDV